VAYIIYADRAIDLKGNNLNPENLKTKFKTAIQINQVLETRDYKTAYMFIDPLTDSFEAANHFYFNVLECTDISMLNIYRSGCGPIQALSDAKMLIENKIVDAVFVFGHEPLASIKLNQGKEFITNAMSIFGDITIPAAYNELAHELLKELDISKEQFLSAATLLYENYNKAYMKDSIESDAVNKAVDRSSLLEKMNADLFTLTDCANPYVDFTGGMIITNKEIADYLEIPAQNQIEIKGAKYNIVADGPHNIDAIVGKQKDIFPHLGKAFRNACSQGQVDFVKEFKEGNALMEVYTCYPPIPLAFLITTKMIEGIEQLADFLHNHEITITGGLNLARAPWNNPAFNSLIALCEKLPQTEKEYGLVHGNGGLGGLQGVAILQKAYK